MNGGDYMTGSFWDILFYILIAVVLFNNIRGGG